MYGTTILRACDPARSSIILIVALLLTTAEELQIRSPRRHPFPLRSAGYTDEYQGRLR